MGITHTQGEGHLQVDWLHRDHLTLYFPWLHPTTPSQDVIAPLLSSCMTSGKLPDLSGPRYVLL